jgi:hypothetical protein
VFGMPLPACRHRLRMHAFNHVQSVQDGGVSVRKVSVGGVLHRQTAWGRERLTVLWGDVRSWLRGGRWQALDVLPDVGWRNRSKHEAYCVIC